MALEREIQLEKKDQIKSYGITVGVIAILAALSLIWVAAIGRVPLIEEPEWKTIGLLADFGNMVEGSSNVNNFEDPSPTPADRPKAVSSGGQTTSQPTKSDNSNNETLTQSTEETGVTAPAKSDDNKNQSSTPTNNADNKNGSQNAAPGGSNDGNGNQIGNKGHPDAKVLNADGRFAFGDGIGGAGGRKPLKLDLPSYTVQQEAKITFAIIIDPSGSVVFAKAEPTPYTDLARIGTDAIKKWRFNEVDDSQGNLKTTVTIKFRLQ